MKIRAGIIGMGLLLALGSGCGTPRPSNVDRAWASASTHGYKAFQQGDYPGAADWYEAALTRARALDDTDAVGDSAYNLAACRLAEGKLDLAADALAAAELAWTDTRLPPELYALKARLLMAQGKIESAWQATEAILADDPGWYSMAQAHLLRCGILLDQNKLDTAREELSAAEQAMDRKNPPLLLGEGAMMRGRIEQADKQPMSAVTAFEKAVAYYRTAAALPEMAAALNRVAGAWSAAGDFRRAGDYVLRSAASYYGQGRYVDALHVIDAGMPIIEKADYEELNKQIASIVRMIREQTGMPEEEE